MPAGWVRRLGPRCFRAFSVSGVTRSFIAGFSQARKVPLVPQQNMKNIKPQLLDKP